MNANAVAQTILAQLGGPRFVAMTGARALVAHADGFSTKLPANFAKGGRNYLRITLNGADLYDVRLSKVGRFGDESKVEETHNVDAEALRRVVETMTGLYVSM